MKNFIMAVITLAATQLNALPNMKNFPHCFEKFNWGHSYMSKEPDFIHMILTKSNDEKLYCGRCIQTGYVIAVTCEEDLIDSICIVTQENSKDWKKSSETQYHYDKKEKIHLASFCFEDDDTRVLFLKTDDGTMQAAFQTTIFNK